MPEKTIHRRPQFDFIITARVCLTVCVSVCARGRVRTCVYPHSLRCWPCHIHLDASQSCHTTFYFTRILPSFAACFCCLSVVFQRTVRQAPRPDPTVMYMTAFLTFCHSHRAEVVAGQGRAGQCQAGQDNVLVLPCRLIFYCVCFTSRSKSPLNCKFFMFEFSASIAIAPPTSNSLHLHAFCLCMCVRVCHTCLTSAIVAFCIWNIFLFICTFLFNVILSHWEKVKASCRFSACYA